MKTEKLFIRLAPQQIKWLVTEVEKTSSKDMNELVRRIIFSYFEAKNKDEFSNFFDTVESFIPHLKGIYRQINRLD